MGPIILIFEPLITNLEKGIKVGKIVWLLGLW